MIVLTQYFFKKKLQILGLIFASPFKNDTFATLENQVIKK
jgi:hypothetical protein